MNAIVRAVEPGDVSCVYTIEVQRNNGSFLAAGDIELSLDLDVPEALAQIRKFGNDMGEKAKPKNQRRLVQVGTVVDLG